MTRVRTPTTYQTVYCRVPATVHQAAQKRVRDRIRKTGEHVTLGAYVAELIERDVTAAQKREQRRKAAAAATTNTTAR